MPDYQGRREADIAAPPQACFDALTDYDAMPQWQRALKRVRVLEHGQDADVVEYEVDAKVRSLKYQLRICYEPPRRIDSAYVDGPFRDFAARWTFADNDAGGTRGTVEVHLDPGRLVPRPVARMVEDALLGRAVGDLKRHVEA